MWVGGSRGGVGWVGWGGGVPTDNFTKESPAILIWVHFTKDSPGKKN